MPSNFIPTSQIWDVSEIMSNNAISPDMKKVFVKMYQKLSEMAMAVNNKASGIHDTQEHPTGRKFFPKPGLTSASNRTPISRGSISKSFIWSDALGVPKSLPNATSDTMAHGLNFDANTILINIWAAATDHTHGLYIRVPHVDCKLGTIGIWATNTDIVIDCCGFDGSDFTDVYIEMEFLRF